MSAPRLPVEPIQEEEYPRLSKAGQNEFLYLDKTHFVSTKHIEGMEIGRTKKKHTIIIIYLSSGTHFEYRQKHWKRTDAEAMMKCIQNVLG